MTIEEALEWCVAEQASIYFRYCARATSEVIVQHPDGLWASRPTFVEAVQKLQWIIAEAGNGPLTVTHRFTEQREGEKQWVS